jgi:aspartyl-tRNA(Asn)/glutamyl-tRNA(Gln) amidotransferase subunit B
MQATGPCYERRVTEYEAVIGLEVHAQLLTQSKLFCACSTAFGGEPNSNVCPVCLGLPGSLPVMNRQALGLAVRAALALGCSLQTPSIFARKNYFYPDLPKGYQISQYEEPFSKNGALEVETEDGLKRVGITRVHLEEDAGKNVHGMAGDSIVDLNRAGVPLIEIVGEPDLRSSAEAALYLRALRDVLVFIGVNDGNLEEGSFRCDANVSIRPRGETKLGTRCELKNLNSYRFVQRAIDVEIARQARVLDSGGSVDQETRSFDPESSTTRTLRSKEDAHDYRYFPEPDLPPLVIEDAMVLAERERVGELPLALRRRLTNELGLSAQIVTSLSAHPEYVRFFEAARARFDHPAKLANWILTEVLRSAKVHGHKAEFAVTPAQVAELLELVEQGTISGKQAKEVQAQIEGSDRSPRALVEQSGVRMLNDAAALEALCVRIVEQHPKQVESLRAGKRGLMGFFVGQVMKETQGSADPKLVTELFEKLVG